MDVFTLHSRIIKDLKSDAKVKRISLEKLDKYIKNFSSDDFVFENMEPSFQEIFKKNIHSKFINLNNSEYPGHKVIFKEWFEGFIDRDNDIIYKLQKSFHGALWEIYLFSILKQKGLMVDFCKSSSPDFIITSPIKICIEACVSNVQEKDNKPLVTDRDRRLKSDNLSLKKPLWKEDESKIKEILDEAIIRYSNAISKKHKLYNDKYLKKDFVRNNPYLLALTSYSQLNYGRENHYGALATFFGKYLIKTEQGYSYLEKEKIIKKGGAEIDVNLFNYKNKNGEYEYNYISAVIFSSKVSLGKITTLAEQLDIQYKKNSNYIFHIYEDLENGEIDLLQVTRYINENLLEESIVKEISNVFLEIDYNPENISNLKNELSKNSQEQAEQYDLMDGLFILHNPNAEIKISMELFDHHRIVQIYQDSTTGELKFYKNSKTLVSSFNYPWFMYPENDPIGFQNLVKENFNSI